MINQSKQYLASETVRNGYRGGEDRQNYLLDGRSSIDLVLHGIQGIPNKSLVIYATCILMAEQRLLTVVIRLQQFSDQCPYCENS